MDRIPSFDAVFRLQHRHKDGSWAELVEDRPHPAPADHDPERAWATARIFRCPTCPEESSVAPRKCDRSTSG
jgi:hypothetical protein